MKRFLRCVYNITIMKYAGKMGENLRLKRALAITTAHDSVIGYSTHGNNSIVPSNGCHVGKFAGVVVLKPSNDAAVTSEDHRDSLEKLACDLSKHVIGMNPVALHPGSQSGVTPEESLMGQDFLLDDKVVVGDLLAERGADVVDFIRFGLTS